MFTWIVKCTIISLVLIILVHYLYIFFKNTLTVPITKDLINKPNKQYNEIIETIKTNITTKEVKSESVQSTNMKNELKEYLATLHKETPDTYQPPAAYSTY